MKTFLTAEWKDLINITYAVEPEKLRPWLPDDLSLDLIDGKAFVSLVAFDFRNVRLKGLKIPFHHTFPEINMRFYVRQNERRGVVFIKEFVPKYLVALVARQLYNEPYHAVRMHTERNEGRGHNNIVHYFKVNKQKFSISVELGQEAWIPAADSAEHFFKEHDIGFGRDKKGNTLSYEVAHPVWEVLPVKALHLNVDFGKIYGEHWKFLNDEKPYHVLLAKGSAVRVYDKTTGNKTKNRD